MILTSKREVPWADEEPQTNPSPIVNGSVAEGYTYDAVGNRLTSAGPTSYNYNASNELTSTSAATYTYDSNGLAQQKLWVDSGSGSRPKV